MALRIPGDSIVAKALNFNPDEYSAGYAGGVYVAQKVFRASIIFNRKGAGAGDPLGNSGIKSPPNAYKSGVNSDFKDAIEKNRGSGTAPSQPSEDKNQWKISIVDYDYNPAFDSKEERPRSLDLMYMPKEVRETQKTAFASLSPLGRNNPHYQFVGSEDMLEFEVDWHSQETYRKDVIRNVKWLQALNRADGWNTEPRRVKIVWSDNPMMWRDDIWILTQAPARYTQFSNKVKAQQTRKVYNGDNPFNRYSDVTVENIVDTGLLPVQAYQNLIFKKVTSNNLTAQEIGQFRTFK